jgi:hypothetical protein
MRSILLYLLGVPIPIIILLALFARITASELAAVVSTLPRICGPAIYFCMQIGARRPHVALRIKRNKGKIPGRFVPGIQRSSSLLAIASKALFRLTDPISPVRALLRLAG